MIGSVDIAIWNHKIPESASAWVFRCQHNNKRQHPVSNWSLQTLIIGISLIIQVGIKISSVHKRVASEKKENPVKKVMVAPRSEAPGKEITCESTTPSWASDHNYNAVKPEKPEKPTALSPTLLSKCTYHPKAGFTGPSHHLDGCLGLPQVFLSSLWSFSGCFLKSCVGLTTESLTLEAIPYLSFRFGKYLHCSQDGTTSVHCSDSRLSTVQTPTSHRTALHNL